MMPTILVPQGAEYQAVCRGLNRVDDLKIQVLAIPVGIKSVYQFLTTNRQNLNHPNQKIILMGLCGSLNQHYRVGNIVLYADCVYQDHHQKCDINLTQDIYNQLGDQISLVKGLTSDRVISSAAEKQNLHQKFGVDVVDMEGFALLEFFQDLNVSIAMLRVVSDDAVHDIPDLTTAISTDGKIQPLPLAKTFIRQPLAAARLIRGSLNGLKILETLAYRLGTDK